jgi:hypothetical protein
MKNTQLWLGLVLIAVTISSCDIIGGVFKAGIYTAIIIIVLVIVLILWLIRRVRK